MIAPYKRKQAPRGFLAIRAGEVSRSGQVAPARRTRSWECVACGQIVRDDVRLLSLHRRGHQTSEGAGRAGETRPAPRSEVPSGPSSEAPQTSDRSGSAVEPVGTPLADATASPAASSGRLA